MTEQLTGASPLRPATRTTSSYTELAQLVRDSGLLSRRRGWYWRRIAAAGLAIAGLVVAMALVGNSWWQLALAAGLGVVLSQVGFLGHDAAHRQIFLSPAWNDWTARILSGAVVGLSYGWWQDKHTRHHAAPNQVGRDPDIAPGLLAFTPEQAAGRAGVFAWLTRHQGWLLFPLLTLQGLSLHADAVWELWRRSGSRRRDRYRVLEAVLIWLRIGGLVAFLLLLLPTGKAAAFVGVYLAVFGVLLGGSFVPNHTGMPVVPRDAKIDFLHRQVLMSRNVRGNVFVDAAMGGLNRQIEHHLFPSMPRPHLRRVRPLVRDYCARRGIPYTESGLLASYGAVVRHLNSVGLGARDPFQCPLAAQLRD
jgi:fatty acid desaturase